MRSVLERDIQRACLDWLAAKGIFAWRSNQIPVPLKDGGFRRFAGLKGVSDILAVITQQAPVEGQLVPMGILCGIEVKQPGKKPTPEQAWFLDELNRRGAIGLCVHSTEELESELTPYL
jgi:hypothetical protein